MSSTAEFSASTLADILSPYCRGRGFCIALSGGADSVALALALAELRSTLSEPVRALHIHHGLQPAADAWPEFCARLCARLNIPFDRIELKLQRLPGESLEATARHARYRAFEGALKPGETLLTAHHQDDQAETLLLNLMKGAGVRGLAAMPEQRALGGGLLLRPLLGFSRRALVNYLRQHRQDWVEDPSNRDLVFDRNYLRHSVMPQLEQRWPAVKVCIARASRHQAEQIELNQALATLDLQAVEHFPYGALKIPALLSLSPARRNNVLRHWLQYVGRAINPSVRQLSVIYSEILALGNSTSAQLKLEAIQVRKFSGYLFQQPVNSAVPEVGYYAWRLSNPLIIPSRGLYLEPQTVLNTVDGLNSHSEMTVKFRRGGERFKPDKHRHHRKLKQLFQEWQVPPWRRSQIPLIYFQNELVMVWGYGVRCNTWF